MTTNFVTLEVTVRIQTNDEADARIAEYIDLPEDNEWGITPGLSKDEILAWLATSCVYGRHNANQDGWADLEPDSISLWIDDVREY